MITSQYLQRSIRCKPKAPQRQYSDLVPESEDLTEDVVDRLFNFLKGKKNITYLTGAGVSTESGIPDYRSPNGSYSKGHKPTTYGEFMKLKPMRQRYWARNVQGWPIFSSVKPNDTHEALALLEGSGHLTTLLTQNVDRLHQKAGSKNVVELHGSSYDVECTGCHSVFHRDHWQERLKSVNSPMWFHELPKSEDTREDTRPDGDFALSGLDFTQFTVPDCEKCGGIIKPGVVMFGENVPKSIVERSFSAVYDSDALIAIGTSLQVYSAFRFAKAAAQNQIPFAIINIGPTRADSIAQLKIEAQSGKIMKEIARRFSKMT
eukprot:TRINITY_DN19523_c0_g1_i1.p1 TRINITY_DN19523_c0_g1~~TRINITY_DN19523_c0_g1_i1.p1  ORF type:complete len:319 (+),score=40.41 TRINITY_DN19523_c0_g1_i1:39-995(+)